MTTIRTGGLVAGLAALAISQQAIADEITFWHSFTQPERIAAMETLAVSFEERTGTAVSLEVVPWDKMTEKWTSAAAAGTLPDASICLPPVCMAMSVAGAARDVTPVLEAPGGPEAFVSEQLLDTFHRYDGKLIALPFYTHARLLIYRKDVFDELGLEPPQTWEEYFEVAKKLTDPPSRYGMVQMWDPSSSGAAQFLYIFMRSNGGAYIGPDGNAAFNSPENIEAVEQLVRLYEVGSPEGEVSIPFHGQTFEMFTSGKSMMTFETMFMAKAIKDKRPDLYEKDAVGFAAPPKRKQLGIFTGVVSIAALNSDNQDAADAWIELLFEPENYLGFLHTIAGGMYPATAAVAQDPAFFDEPHIQRVRDGVELTLEIMPQGADVGNTYGVNPGAVALETGIIERMMQDIVLNGTPVEQAVAAVHGEIQAHIDRIRDR